MSSRNLAPCGTRSAYKRHKRWGEEVCDECREASRKYNEKYQEKWNEKRRQRNGSKPRVPKPKPEPRVVSLPEVVQGPEGVGPCVMPENGFVWDPRRDGETLQRARERHRIARAICVTSCPVFTWCQQEFVPEGGVVARDKKLQKIIGGEG